jgi:hypothetical protein
MRRGVGSGLPPTRRQADLATLRRALARLLEGLPDPNGNYLRLQSVRPRKRPADPLRVWKVDFAASAAMKLIRGGMGRDKAIKQASREYGYRAADIRKRMFGFENIKT